MNTKALITIIVILLILVGVGYFFLLKQPTNTVVLPPANTSGTNATITLPPVTSSSNTATGSASSGTAAAPTSTATSVSQQELDQQSQLPPVEYTITAKNYSFTPNRINIEPGSRVRLTVKNEGGTHDLVIPAFNVATKRLNSGEQATVEFTANKAGTFEFYCSVDGHRAMGMTGTLIIGGEE